MSGATGAPPPTSDHRVVVPANPSQPTDVQVAPRPPDTTGQYPLDVTDAVVVTSNQKQYYRFPKLGVAVTNQEHRPKFYYGGKKVRYTGPGTGVSDSDHQQIQAFLQEPLAKLMQAMRDEGARINDEGMKTAWIGSAWRSWETDGELFLKEVRKQIKKDPTTFPTAFPAGLEAEASSNLRDASDYNGFIAHLGAATGWTKAMAAELMRRSTNAKGPGGRSPHESGLVVDINFTYATLDKNGHDLIKAHDITTENNSSARLSASGKWLERYAGRFDFSSYNTGIEIWHYEYLKWEGTAADPAVKPTSK